MQENPFGTIGEDISSLLDWKTSVTSQKATAIKLKDRIILHCAFIATATITGNTVLVDIGFNATESAFAVMTSLTDNPAFAQINTGSRTIEALGSYPIKQNKWYQLDIIIKI